MLIYQWKFSLWFDLLFAFLSIIFLISSYRYGKYRSLRIPFILTIYVFLSLYWFALGGVYGAPGMGAIVVSIVVLIISPAKFRIHFVILTGILVITLTIIQEVTDWITPPDYAASSFVGNFMVLFLSASAVVYFFKEAYDSERQRNLEQNQKLETLNQDLIASLSKTEQTIERLQNTQSQLIESEKLAGLGKVVSEIAHELNNPLNYMGGMVKPLQQDIDEIVEVLEKNNLEEELVETLSEVRILLEGIENGAQQSTKYLQQLNSLVPNQKEHKVVTISISEILTNVVEQVENAYAGISIKIEDSSRVKVKANATEINQVFLNLLREFSDLKLKGTIYVQVQTQRERVQITFLCKNCLQPDEPVEVDLSSNLRLYIAQGMTIKNDGTFAVRKVNKKDLKALLELPALPST
jgi:signal transduction histidine kinase